MVVASVERAYLALMERGLSEAHEASVLEMRRSFERRTGAFSALDPWFEARSAAFWDDALVGGFARAVMHEVSEPLRVYVAPLSRAHRGLFRVGHGRVLSCALTGAAFTVDAPSFPGLADALEHAQGFVQGFVCGAPSPRQVVLLQGAVFHSPDATQAIDGLLVRARPLPVGEVLDALLRMDRTFHAMARPKAQLAYRPEALTAGPVMRNVLR